MDATEKRARELIKLMVETEHKNFSSIKTLTNYFKSSFDVTERVLQKSVVFAIKNGWFSKGTKTSWGGTSAIDLTPAGFEISDKTYPDIRTVSADTLKQKTKPLGLVNLITELGSKLETVLIEHDQQTDNFKIKINQLEETINSVQIDKNRIDQLSDKINKIEEEISAGTEKLLQILNMLKSEEG